MPNRKMLQIFSFRRRDDMSGRSIGGFRVLPVVFPQQFHVARIVHPLFSVWPETHVF
jgi:hypothetical protein